MPKASGQGTESKGKRAKTAKSRAHNAKAPAKAKGRRATKSKTASNSKAPTSLAPASGDCASKGKIEAKAAVTATSPRSDRKTYTPPTEAGDDFALIRGIDHAAEHQIRTLGYKTYEALANLDAMGVARIGRALADPRRLSREGWIEQAAILATGELTAFARNKLQTDCPSAVIITFPKKNRRAHVSLKKTSKARKRKKPARSRPLPPIPRRKQRPTDTPPPEQTDTNVIRFPSERVTPPVHEKTHPWLVLAAPLVLLAVAALSSLGWSTNFPAVVQGLNCTDILPTLVMACQHLPGLMN